MRQQEEYPEDNVADSGDTAAESSYYHMSEFQSLYEESQSQIEELRKENTKLKAEYIPKVSYCDVDMNDYREHPCIYLIHIRDNDYKFGETGEIDKRYYKHMNDFTKRGCKPKLIKIWKCKSMQIMKNTEKQIKHFASQNNIKVKKYDKTEIITTDNIKPVVDVICKYVERGNKKDEDYQKVYLAELELENNRVLLEISNAKLEKIRVKLELRKLDIEPAKLNIESTDLQNSAETDIERDNIVDDKNVVCNNIDDIDNVPDIIDNPIIPDVPEVVIVAQPANIAVNTKAHRKQTAKTWIQNNNPNHGEITKNYYERYKTGHAHPLNHNEFGPIVREVIGRDPIKGTNNRHW